VSQIECTENPNILTHNYICDKLIRECSNVAARDHILIISIQQRIYVSYYLKLFESKIFDHGVPYHMFSFTHHLLILK